MKHTTADLFSALFTAGDKVNIRVIKDAEGKTTNRLFLFPVVLLCADYPDAFPCVGVNPRETTRKLFSGYRGRGRLQEPSA